MITMSVIMINIGGNHDDHDPNDENLACIYICHQQGCRGHLWWKWKKRNITVVKVKRKKTRNAVNITVVKVYDKYIEYYRCDNNSRGHSLVQIYPGGRGGYNLPLQHNCHRHIEPLFRFCRRNVLQRKVLVRLMWEKLKWVRLRLKQNLAVLVALRSWYRVFFLTGTPQKS